MHDLRHGNDGYSSRLRAFELPKIHYGAGLRAIDLCVGLGRSEEIASRRFFVGRTAAEKGFARNSRYSVRVFITHSGVKSREQNWPLGIDVCFVTIGAHTFCFVATTLTARRARGVAISTLSNPQMRFERASADDQLPGRIVRS